LSPVEVDALMAALRTHRDRVMVAAMVLGGLRRCEVLGLRLDDLHVAERRVFIDFAIRELTAAQADDL
jgi:integrase/recombinase XerD